MISVLRAALAALTLALSATAALAHDWEVTRLRGGVLQLVDGEWLKLERGGVVPDNRVIRTLANGHVEFQRGEEQVALAPNTQIQIFDKGGRKPFTTVKQYFGEVTIEAEVRNVQHFAVETPYLAAVVKGTKFVVTSGDDGAEVAVKRGHVFVEDHATHESVTVNVGQTASVGSDADGLSVSGRGAASLKIAKPKSSKKADKAPKPDDKSAKPEKPAKPEKSKPGVGVAVTVGPLDVSVSHTHPDKPDKLVDITVGPLKLKL
jgi:hypothetical protein